MKTLGLRLVAVALAFAAAGRLQAQNPQITADENGNASILFPGSLPTAIPCTATPDPGPGGLLNAFFCDMLGPPSLTFGDLLIHDVDGTLSDVIRFERAPATTGPFGFFFYSLLGPDLFDRGLPSAFQANTFNAVETNLGGGVNGVNYHPATGQPGFVAGFDVFYTFKSAEEATVAPEPATLVLTATGFVGLGGVVAARRRRS